jgi:hypothetical protein
VKKEEETHEVRIAERLVNMIPEGPRRMFRAECSCTWKGLFRTSIIFAEESKSIHLSMRMLHSRTKDS